MYHTKYMERCLELAARGKGHVAPNPMVGAVVVCHDRIIGEGYHQQYGGLHAEPNAIASVKDQRLLAESTLYVNLEPCSHYGKTPPCAQLIIDKKIPRVVVGGLDPFPEVSGRGISMLQAAGVEVVAGVLEEQCEALNKRFLTFHRNHRPYIVLKWAQSADGFMDVVRKPNDGQQAIVFSSETTQALCHKLRSEEAAILVGTRTAILDNPSLTVRKWGGQSPLRIFIDRRGTVPSTHHLYSGTESTWALTESRAAIDHPAVTSIELDFNQDILPQIMQVLVREKIQSLIVEGGACLLNSFIVAGLWDEAFIETSEIGLGQGVKSPHIGGVPSSVSCFGKSVVRQHKNSPCKLSTE